MSVARGGTGGWLGAPSHSRWLEAHLDGLLAFGREAAIPTGFGSLDGAGRLAPSTAPGRAELYVTCRMTHVYSLATLLGRPGAAPLVDHGLAALTGVFEDREHGGWYPAVGSDGAELTDKEAYGHAFVLLAASSATVAERPGARALLDRALRVHDERFWDDDAGMVVETWDRAWGVLDDYRGINANMHTTEAYLAVADALDDARWRARALRVLDRAVREARAHDWRLPEHFDEEWDPLLDYNEEQPAHPFRPYGATIGHGFEWARLAATARAAERAAGASEPATAWLLDAARALFDAAVRDGWHADGRPGFVYTVDFSGEPVVRARLHWVVTEAIAAAAALWSETAKPSYARWYETWWDYAASHLIDGSGSWIHELDERNREAATVWAGKPDLYHAVQATLIPRLPLWPTLATALAHGNLDRIGYPTSPST